MTVGSDFRVSLPALGTSHANYALGLDPDTLAMSQPRLFKRHKVLPHPRKDDALPSSLLRYGLGSDSSLPPNGASTPTTPSSRQRATRLARGPEPPPTPPAHSRTSSASHPTDPSSPNNPGTPSASTSNVVASRPPAPVTPPAQQTPPTPNLTPDRTPPGPAAVLLLQRRPPVSERNSSRVTTDSRAESFRTAPENPYSSDDDGEGKSASRPPLPSARPLHNAARQANAEKRSFSHPVGLGLGLGSSLVDDATPRTIAEFDKFDGEWTGGERGANVPGEWDDGLMRNVTIRKRRPTRSAELGNPEVVDDRTVTPTNATRALRSMSLDESPVLRTQRRVVSDRLPASTAPANSDSSSSIEVKRSSVMSTRSNASTVVEAMLVIETTPQRRKTLRHVRKQITLRDSSSELSPPSSAPTSVSPAADDRRRRPEPSDSKAGEAVRESYASTATNNSISSRKARRSVWKNGGVPVVVIPDRRSSVHSNSKSPSLRSTSSRRTRSLSSVPISHPSKSRDLVAQPDRPPAARRSRAMSESDGSRAGDERTMDFPPVIPARSSSLSAPTSRNPSRTASLTTESLSAHNMLQAQKAHHALQTASRELDKLNNQSQQSGTSDDSRETRRALGHSPMDAGADRGQPTITVDHAARGEKSETGESPAHARRDRDPHTTPVDRDGDPFFGKRLSVQNTPFSVASVETTGTSHAEVSEAMAVNIYPHQSKSVVLVNHSAKPSESSTVDQYKTVAGTTDTSAAVPSTPPQRFTMGDVDSPLRNPRAPPIPPAINFTPATPSGLTPAPEKKKQLGNFYEITAQKPKRSMSLLRRALSRRTADYGPSSSRPTGLLTRTFSLSRRRGDGERWPTLKRHSTADDALPDESRLHPFWRPAFADDSDESCSSDSDDSYDESEDSDEDRTYRYPPIDNRPSPPRRSLSTRIKHTFSILPQPRSSRDRHEDEQYPATADDAPDRRTIRRTPSGNLRVMKFRRSMESITRAPAAGTGADGRPYTAPAHQQLHSAAGGGRYTRLIRSLSNKARRSVRRRASSVSQAGVGEGVGSETTAAPAITAPVPAAAPAVAPAVALASAPAPPAPTRTAANTPATTGFLPALGERINIARRLSERRRERRTQELRGMISAPREVRDGVGEVIRKDLRVGGQLERGMGLGQELGQLGRGQGQGQGQGQRPLERQQQHGLGQEARSVQRQQQQQQGQERQGQQLLERGQGRERNLLQVQQHGRLEQGPKVLPRQGQTQERDLPHQQQQQQQTQARSLAQQPPQQQQSRSQQSPERTRQQPPSQQQQQASRPRPRQQVQAQPQVQQQQTQQTPQPQHQQPTHQKQQAQQQQQQTPERIRQQRQQQPQPWRDRDALYVREQQEERQRLRAQLRMERVGRG